MGMLGGTHTQLEIAFKARQTCQLAYVTLMLWRDRNLTQHMKEDYKLKYLDGRNILLAVLKRVPQLC